MHYYYLLSQAFPVQIVGMVIGGLIVLTGFFLFISFIKIYVQAMVSGAHVGFLELIGMKLRKVPAHLIVNERISALKAGVGDLPAAELESVYLVRQSAADVVHCVSGLVMAHKAGLPITFTDLQAHHFAGGDVESVVVAMIGAHRAKIPLSLDVARAIDLAGRDIKEAVQTTVKPKIIDCPTQANGPAMLDAVAKDGIRLLIKARVTVRSNIQQLVRGATEETIIARVGQGIVSAIGSSTTYKDVLENPDRISKTVLASGLDAQTAYEIVSIDIADISVASVRDVANVGALLETERAEADKQLRQAEAEGRAAMARAREQEMKALVQENIAKVTLAEAEVPLAMAEAFRSGNMGIMDYYKMKNIQADTQMRDTLGKEDDDA
jgi:uncharacterized protein YqfA (UPF0365 family)